jgi:5-methylcytosine-specific restriction endonuclease McrA
MKRIEFTKATKREAFRLANGVCQCSCGQPFGKQRVEYHHRKEARDGGDGSLANCIPLRSDCHRRLTDAFLASCAKSRGMSDLQANIKPKHVAKIPQRPKQPRPRRDQLPMPARRQLYL